MEPNETNPIRKEWMFEVRSACQGFVGRSWGTDRTKFEHALRWLAETVPAAEISQEHEALDNLLKLSAINAAARFHREYHEQFNRKACRGFSLESTLSVWAGGAANPRDRFDRWRGAFVSAFDTAHPWLPCERAAAILRRRFRTPPRLEELAAESASSRSALAREFKRHYGMRIGEHTTRLKLSWFVEAVRSSSRSCTELGLEAGYRSYHNLSGALERRTGLTPGQLRTLDAAGLLDVRKKLALRIPALQESDFSGACEPRLQIA